MRQLPYDAEKRLNTALSGLPTVCVLRSRYHPMGNTGDASARCFPRQSCMGDPLYSPTTHGEPLGPFQASISWQSHWPLRKVHTNQGSKLLWTGFGNRSATCPFEVFEPNASGCLTTNYPFNNSVGHLLLGTKQMRHCRPVHPTFMIENWDGTYGGLQSSIHQSTLMLHNVHTGH